MRTRADWPNEPLPPELLVTCSAAIAHEFSSILFATAFNLHAACKAGGQSDQAHMLEMAQKLVAQAQSLTSSLLSLVESKNRPVQARFEIQQWLPEAVQRVTDFIGPKLAAQLSNLQEPTHVAADPFLVELVLRILLINAANAMPEGGVVAIEVTTATEDKSTSVTIRLQDNGPGLSKDLYRRISEPFVTTKGSVIRSGLGLPIAQRLVATLGSELTIEAVMPHGTAFTFSLPVVEGSISAEEP